MTVYTSSMGAVVQGMNTELPAVADMTSGSPSYLIQHIGGRELEKEDHQIDGNGAQADNIFVLTGVVLVHRLQFTVGAVTDATDFEDVQFALYDGTATLDITTVVNGDGCIEGDYFYKKGLKNTALIHVDTSVGVIEEAAANKVSFEPFFCGKKSGAATYIQLLFNGDGATDFLVDFEAYYTPASHGASLVSA